jgi:transposase
MRYSTDVRRTALEKMLQPGAPQLSAISRDMDIPKDTLYGWLRKAKQGKLSNDRSRKMRTGIQEKMAAILTARSLRDEELGRWLREQGFHEVQLKSWEQEINAALENSAGSGGREAEQRQRIKELERELNRKDKALAEMSALMVLKKKWAAILGDEESAT